MSETPRPGDPSFTAADIDLDLVADDLADALDPVDAAALRELLARDPAARARHDEFADALDGVAAVLAAQPQPVLPDEVGIRLDAALARESAARAGGAASRSPDASAAVQPPGRSAPSRVRGWRRAFGPWAGGLLGTAAVAGGLFFALHSVGGSSNSSSSVPRAEAAASNSQLSGTSSAAGASAPSAAAFASPAAPALGAPHLAGASPVAVTAGSLTSVVQALFAAGAGHALPVDSLGPKPAGATASADDDLCLPAGVPPSATIVSRDPVTFRGAPATLLVLHERGAPARVVRAEVFRGCSSAVLLTGTVTLSH